MFWVRVSGPDGLIGEIEFESDEVNIGAHQDNDLVLSGAEVSERHGRLLVRDGVFILVDLKSEHGIAFNGRRIAAPHVVSPHDRIVVGGFVLTLLAWTRGELSVKGAMPAGRVRRLFPAGVLARHPCIREALDALERGGACEAELRALKAMVVRVERGLGFGADPDSLFAVKALIAGLQRGSVSRAPLLSAIGVAEDGEGARRGLRSDEEVYGEVLGPVECFDGGPEGALTRLRGASGEVSWLVRGDSWRLFVRREEFMARAFRVKALDLPMLPRPVGLSKLPRPRGPLERLDVMAAPVGGVSLRRWMARARRPMGAPLAARVVAHLCVLGRALIEEGLNPTAFMAHEVWLDDEERLTWFGALTDPCGLPWREDVSAAEISGPLILPAAHHDELAALYFAPEVIDDQGASPQSLVYALGGLLYWLLTGRPPLDVGEEGVVGAVARRLNRPAPPAPPSSFNSSIHPALDDVVMACLELEASARPQSPGELLERLWPHTFAPDDEVTRLSANARLERVRRWCYEGNVLAISAWLRHDETLVDDEVVAHYVLTHVPPRLRELYGVDALYDDARSKVGFSHLQGKVTLAPFPGHEVRLDAGAFQRPEARQALERWLDAVAQWERRVSGLLSAVERLADPFLDEHLTRALLRLRPLLHQGPGHPVERALHVLEWRWQSAEAFLARQSALARGTGAGGPTEAGLACFRVLLDPPAGRCARCLSPDDPGHPCLLALQVPLAPVLAEVAAPMVSRPTNLSLQAPLDEGWFNGSPFVAGVSSDYEAHPRGSGHRAARLVSPVGVASESFGVLAQCFPSGSLPGRLVRVTVRLRAVLESGWAGAWVRVEGRDGSSIFFDNMEDRPLSGDFGWQTVHLVAPVPPDAAWFLMGALLSGEGVLHVDTFRISFWREGEWSEWS